MNDPAHIYNEKRRIVRATTRGDVAKARHYLESYFTGKIGGEMSRIDVTTNINFKKLKSYEPFRVKGHRYCMTVWDRADFSAASLNELSRAFLERSD